METRILVGVSLRPESVGAADEWPAGGGVFMVLQRGGFDPRIGQRPANWNSGAWLSSGLLAGVAPPWLGAAGGSAEHKIWGLADPTPHHVVVWQGGWRARRDSNPRPADPKSDARGSALAPLARAQ